MVTEEVAQYIVSLAASSFLLFYSALQGLVKPSALGGQASLWLQYFSLFEHLSIEFFASAREDFFNVLACASTCLETFVYSLTLCELNCSVKCDFSLVFQLTLVSDEVNSHIFRSVLFNLFQPTPQIVKSFIACDIIGQEDAVCATIENSCYRFERLLSSLKLRHH